MTKRKRSLTVEGTEERQASNHRQGASRGNRGRDAYIVTAKEKAIYVARERPKKPKDEWTHDPI